MSATPNIGSETVPGVVLVDVDVPLPDIWTAHPLGAAERATAEAELAALLHDDLVAAGADPDEVVAESMDEFYEKLGVGGVPMMIASFREELSDESILACSLIVARNELGASLDPWREAYGDEAIETEVLDSPALRIEERVHVDAAELFVEPIQVVTWRYVVPFDARSVLTFAFSSPNHELADSLLDHVDTIMSGVTVTRSAPTVDPTD